MYYIEYDCMENAKYTLMMTARLTKAINKIGPNQFEDMY